MANKMPEAEVTLRLAFWLLDTAPESSHADIAVDGAHVRIAPYEHAGRQIAERVVFDIRAFLATNECRPERLTDEWRGTYRRRGKTLRIRSISGFDVQVRSGGKTIKVECKGGPLETAKGQAVANILASAIGQVICAAGSEADAEELWIAVPDAPAFENAARRLLTKRAFRNTGTHIALVGRSTVRRLG